ncbi:hypothetical protein C5167_016881 [Papaver somniferum]|uniref:BHLH domain-containing protein n=1 Tax=Papaver somniferum TaxID=3469 RepID=A0A4Y7ILX6_PAPSO|nr:hypothetical protein C5167_016881 [Papaver somniferum]
MYEPCSSSSSSSSTTTTTSLACPVLESDEISLFVQHLFHSSSSSTITCTSSSSSSIKQMPLSAQFAKSFQEDQQNRSCLTNHLPDHTHHNRNIHSDFRLRNDSSNLFLSSSAAAGSLYFPSASSSEIIKDSTTTTTTVISDTGGVNRDFDQKDSDAVNVSVKRRKFPVDNIDLDDYDGESEEGLEGSEGPSKTVPSRSSSKRSRAAEVHNLSEKRRRSRINEKMKALQNLIPNSNKTDKASMLDEAIEYLKQLQLQVQQNGLGVARFGMEDTISMWLSIEVLNLGVDNCSLGEAVSLVLIKDYAFMLSMRNGLSLHPLYLPGVLQPPQMTQMRNMSFGEGNALPQHMNIGTGTHPASQEAQNSFALSNQSTALHQPMVLPNMTNIALPTTSFGLDSSLIQLHHGQFQLSTASEEIYREDVPLPQQLHKSISTRNASASVPFDSRSSIVENTDTVESSVARGNRPQAMLPKDVTDDQNFIQHMHNIHTRSLMDDDGKIKTKTVDF